MNSTITVDPKLLEKIKASAEILKVPVEQMINGIIADYYNRMG